MVNKWSDDTTRINKIEVLEIISGYDELRVCWRADRVGRAIERWALRCTDSTILADLATGCRCGCVQNALALGEVARARLEQKAFNCTKRRDDLRRFLDMNGAPSRPLGFNLHGDDSLKPLCVVGYAVRLGNRLAWFYKHITDQRKGNGFDDPSLGAGTAGVESAVLIWTRTAPSSCLRTGI